MKKIVITDLYKSFGPKKVLQGVDLELDAAESVVVIGGSGTGKSVLLKCILGLIRPDRGSMVRSTPSSTTLAPNRFFTPIS